MADLTGRVPDEDRRGQILLVTGFALAVAFLGLALVFNSVIYTENLATRSESTTTSDPLLHVQSVTTGTEDVIEYVNEYNTSGVGEYAPLHQNLTWAFDNVTARMVKHQLNDGQVVNDSLGTAYNGTWIKQTNEDWNFTNVDNETTWTLVENAKGARSFRIYVSAESQLEGNDDPAGLDPDNEEPFNVTATDGTDTWRLNVSNNPRGLAGSSTSLVGVETASGEHVTCPVASAPPFWVNVSAGTVDGAECPGLDFAAGLSRVEDIEFNNASNVNGTYRLMVNKSWDGPNVAVGTPVVDETDYRNDPRFPFTEPALYGARVFVGYESSALTYRTDVRVIPGEDDA